MVMEERACMEAQVESPKQQGLYILQLTLAPWHTTKDTSMWGQDKHGIELICHAIDILYTVDPAGTLHPLPGVETHHPIRKKKARPTKINGGLDQYFQGFTPMEYGQRVCSKFNFQSKVPMETILSKFNELAKR